MPAIAGAYRFYYYYHAHMRFSDMICVMQGMQGIIVIVQDDIVHNG